MLLIAAYLVYALKLPSPKSVLITIFIVIISPLLVGYLMVFYLFPAAEVEIPDVTRRSSQEAFSILRKEGLKPRISNRAFDADVSAGKVIEQQPKKGKKVKTGRIVNLTISTGQRRIPTPNLIGRPYSQVSSLLSDAGLRVGTTTEVETDKFQSGIIVEQRPSPEVEIDSGSHIDIFISRNPMFGLVNMPYLIGKDQATAEDALSKINLNVKKIEYQETDIVAPGIVMRQEPAWDEEVSVGSSVKLTVSKAMKTE
jgi:beta-lactam-binding protein with PASTA domain